jgi:hypothetical protein
MKNISLTINLFALQLYKKHDLPYKQSHDFMLQLTIRRADTRK